MKNCGQVDQIRRLLLSHGGRFTSTLCFALNHSFEGFAMKESTLRSVANSPIPLRS